MSELSERIVKAAHTVELDELVNCARIHWLVAPHVTDKAVAESVAAVLEALADPKGEPHWVERLGVPMITAQGLRDLADEIRGRA